MSAFPQTLPYEKGLSRKAPSTPDGKAYMAWISSLPCCVTGKRPVTVHHVRRFGSARDDFRTVPLIASLHMRGCEKPGLPCVERGKRVFEDRWNIDLEATILRLRAKYEAIQKGTK